LVHVYGNPCSMDAIVEFTKKRKLLLIEDCCESIGATFDGKPMGTFGEVGTFSLYFSHHITTLEGGMCVTKSKELVELMGILRSHGWIRQVQEKEKYLRSNPGIDPKFLFVNQGYNFRATELQGGFGSVQLKKLPQFIQRRQETAAYWLKQLSKYE